MISSDLRTPGARLKKVRKMLGLTQREFGEPLGLKWHQIKDMEAGKLLFRPELARRIEKIYSINFRWLLIGEGPIFLNEVEMVFTLPQEILVAFKDSKILKIVRLLASVEDDIKEEILGRLQSVKRMKDLEKELEELRSLLQKVKKLNF